jgi:multimeric flavodoxin WrbA
MKILILNGSPRPNGNTKQMIDALCEGLKKAGHEWDVVNVARMNIHGCLACEYCHGKGAGSCVQKDDMQNVYELLKTAEMLVLAAPIYYHGMSGQMKCCIDRFYAVLYPEKPEQLTKIAMILSSGMRQNWSPENNVYCIVKSRMPPNCRKKSADSFMQSRRRITSLTTERL